MHHPCVVLRHVSRAQVSIACGRVQCPCNQGACPASWWPSAPGLGRLFADGQLDLVQTETRELADSRFCQAAVEEELPRPQAVRLGEMLGAHDASMVEIVEIFEMEISRNTQYGSEQGSETRRWKRDNGQRKEERGMLADQEVTVEALIIVGVAPALCSLATCIRSFLFLSSCPTKGVVGLDGSRTGEQGRSKNRADRKGKKRGSSAFLRN